MGKAPTSRSCRISAATTARVLADEPRLNERQSNGFAIGLPIVTVLEKPDRCNNASHQSNYVHYSFSVDPRWISTAQLQQHAVLLNYTSIRGGHCFRVMLASLHNKTYASRRPPALILQRSHPAVAQPIANHTCVDIPCAAPSN